MVQQKPQKAEILDASVALVPSHTPTPWEYRAGDYNRDDHGSAPGSIVSVGDEWFIATIEDAPSAEANAAFIVRACNSHDALVSALESLVTAWEALPSGYHSPLAVEAWLSRHMKPAIDTARNVISEAKEAQP